MVTRVLSILRGADAGAARAADPAVDTTAFAVADDLELTVVLKDRAVELGVAGTRCRAVPLAGVEVPVAAPGTDLRALLGSGVRVYAVAEDLAARGLRPGALLDGIEPLPEADLAPLLVTHDVTLTTTS
jgi:sulfur transfer complex TusBCD TusB component (DsrH family)